MTYASIVMQKRTLTIEHCINNAKFYGERKNETKHSIYNVELLSGF